MKTPEKIYVPEHQIKDFIQPNPYFSNTIKIYISADWFKEKIKQRIAQLKKDGGMIGEYYQIKENELLLSEINKLRRN